jgi:hypothetical protein
MSTKQIRAIDVEEGQQITAVPSETLRKRRGVWPTVIEQSFLQNGEGGKPTVYIRTHEKPQYVWCLNPDDLVTVEVA